ncbi:MerR family transcriptional regulator [Flavobacteriaceae bacterium]|jgi:DNA-binding transcriptional MerR regulator|nr:MerR family transcriptional regulator [Flavobacteriaceae bacterium]|tara:strand:+ start:144 stop:461 length:318 start_codon:yes stop_codon:yes gene_type:complete
MHVNLPEKLYYTIGEVSKAFKVNPSLIRFWEKEFEVLKPKKNSKGTRRYSSVDIENFQTIHHLVKEKGYTLEGAKEQLKILKKKFEVIKKLEKIKATLINIKGEI